MRVTSSRAGGFDFTNGAGGSDVQFAPGFAPGLVLESVEQVTDGACSDGNCGPTLAVSQSTPCNMAESSGGVALDLGAMPVNVSTIDGFQPVD